MVLAGTGKRLTIFVGEQDRFHRRSLAQAITERAREEGLAGAMISRGIEGFGASGTLHTTRFLSSSDDLPLCIQIVDEAHRIETFLPIVAEMITDGLATVEDVEIVAHRRPSPRPLDDDPAL